MPSNQIKNMVTYVRLSENDSNQLNLLQLNLFELLSECCWQSIAHHTRQVYNSVQLKCNLPMVRGQENQWIYCGHHDIIDWFMRFTIDVIHFNIVLFCLEQRKQTQILSFDSRETKKHNEEKKETILRSAYKLAQQRKKIW